MDNRRDPASAYEHPLLLSALRMSRAPSVMDVIWSIRVLEKGAFFRAYWQEDLQIFSRLETLLVFDTVHRSSTVLSSVFFSDG